MPQRPTRPGKHAARHKAPSAFSRAAQRLAPSRPALRVRRTGGTFVALSAAVLAGAAGNATGGSAVADRATTTTTTTADRPVAGATPAPAPSQERAARVAAAGDASRGQAREPLSQALGHRRHPGTSDAGADAGASAHTARAESEDPREIAESMLAEYGWGPAQMDCLDKLWVSESNWEVGATNPTSGAYGIPQALPPQKMATAGSDWRTNPATQIEWGLKYIDLSYGTPCSAWEFKQGNNWY